MRKGNPVHGAFRRYAELLEGQLNAGEYRQGMLAWVLAVAPPALAVAAAGAAGAATVGAAAAAGAASLVAAGAAVGAGAGASAAALPVTSPRPTAREARNVLMSVSLVW